MLKEIISEKEFNPDLTKNTFDIEGEEREGYTFRTPRGEIVFVYSNGATMGNRWSLIDVKRRKHLIVGRSTRKKVIEEVGMW